MSDALSALDGPLKVSWSLGSCEQNEALSTFKCLFLVGYLLPTQWNDC